jgi:hypothetical protein
MKTKLLMTSSAVAMALAGAACTFAPQELLRAAAAPAVGLLPVAVQSYGALLLGFAMLNWMAKDSLIGGIYNRPAAVGNLLHFAAAAIARIKAGALVPAAVYALFAIGFAMIVFTSPVSAK